jgi:hypothetical protein
LISSNCRMGSALLLQEMEIGMTDIRMHPDDLEGESEAQLQAAADFFIHIGLLKEGDRFVADASAARISEAEPEARTGSTCHDACRAAYEIAKKACNLGNYKKCRKKAKKAYEICVAACDL